MSADLSWIVRQDVDCGSSGGANAYAYAELTVTNVAKAGGWWSLSASALAQVGGESDSDSEKQTSVVSTDIADTTPAEALAEASLSGQMQEGRKVIADASVSGQTAYTATATDPDPSEITCPGGEDVYCSGTVRGYPHITFSEPPLDPFAPFTLSESPFTAC